MDLPVGYRFNPTDEELVGYFLRSKLSGDDKIPQYLIRDCDVFSTEPWNLPWHSFQYQTEERHMYFFTPRHPTCPHMARFDGRAGCGCWEEVGQEDPIRDGLEDIGHRTHLNFMIYHEKSKKDTDWRMIEFRLNSPSNDKVLCRIYRKTNEQRVEEEKCADSATSSVAFSVEKEEEGRNRVDKRGAGHGMVADINKASVAFFVDEQKSEEGEGCLAKRRKLTDYDSLIDETGTLASIDTELYLQPDIENLASASIEELDALPSLASNEDCYAGSVGIKEKPGSMTTEFGEKGTEGKVFIESSAQNASPLPLVLLSSPSVRKEAVEDLDLLISNYTDCEISGFPLEKWLKDLTRDI